MDYKPKPHNSGQKPPPTPTIKTTTNMSLYMEYSKYCGGHFTTKAYINWLELQILTLRNHNPQRMR